MGKVIKGVDIPRQVFKAGEVIFTEAQESQCFYIIKGGEVDIFRNHGKPDQLLLATIQEGRVLGELSAIDGGNRSATAVAKTDVDVVKISSETIRYQLKQCPSWFRAIIRDLADRLRATDELLSKHGVKNAVAVSSMKAAEE